MPKTLKTLKQIIEDGALYKSFSDFSSTPTNRQSCAGQLYAFTQ